MEIASALRQAAGKPGRTAQITGQCCERYLNAILFRARA
jgi:hypothetical protein